MADSVASPPVSSPPPRLLIVVPNSLRVGGGQEQDILQLTSRLARGSFRVRVVEFSTFYREEPRLSDGEVTARLEGSVRTTVDSLPGIRLLTSVPTIRAARQLRQEMMAADVVLSCPYYLEDAFVVVLARLNRRPLVASQNNTFLHRVPGNPREALQDLWNRHVGVRLLRSIAGVRTASTDEQQTLNSLGVARTAVFYGFPPVSVSSAPSPVPTMTPDYPPEGRPGSSPELRVLVAGRMTVQKGIYTLAGILDRLGKEPGNGDRFHFAFAGTRHLPKVIDRYVREAPERAENLGFIPEGLAGAFRRSDVLLMPSLYESLGSTAIEALRHGVPVIASDVSGLREVVRPAETGWLVPPGDVDGFLAALERCRDLKVTNPAAWNELKSRSQGSYERRFGADAIEAQYSRFVSWLRSKAAARS